MSLKHIKVSLLFIAAIILTLGLSISFQSLLAVWTAPAASPPTCASGNPGCSAPINESLNAQYKAGALDIGQTLHGYGSAFFDGSVGIGTTNPGAALDVMGNIAFRTGDKFAFGGTANMSNYYMQYNTQTSGLDLVENGSSVMFWKYNGYVGIGTANPGYRLDIPTTGELRLGGLIIHENEINTIGTGNRDLYLGHDGTNAVHITAPLYVNSYRLYKCPASHTLNCVSLPPHCEGQITTYSYCTSGQDYDLDAGWCNPVPIVNCTGL